MAKNFLTLLKHLLQIQLKLNKKERFWIRSNIRSNRLFNQKKLLIKLQESQKLLQQVIRKQMKKEYLGKDIYSQIYDKKLLMT